MPTPAQLSRFMSASHKITSTHTTTLESDLRFAAAMPLHALQPLDAPKIVNFAEHVRIVKESGFNRPSLNEVGETSNLSDELDKLIDEEFDEAAMPAYQMISTFARKKLKMKKHQR
mmetsp:Transcript_35569/g.46804  ORF Transcript_35569/g.46804 Transcript_35569/m.46804 type:complete len:116 (+) Transcript_35569:45-392(+)